MRDAIVYEADDIKEILAERHHVDPKNVIRNQYSYTVILGTKKEAEPEAEGLKS